MMSCGEHPEEIEEIQETEETEEIITHVEVTALMLRNIIIIKMIEKKLTLVLPVLFQSRKGTTRKGYEKELVIVVVEEEEEEEVLEAIIDIEEMLLESSNFGGDSIVGVVMIEIVFARYM
jgi:hypothetical protein